MFIPGSLWFQAIGFGFLCGVISSAVRFRCVVFPFPNQGIKKIYVVTYCRLYSFFLTNYLSDWIIFSKFGSRFNPSRRSGRTIIVKLNPACRLLCSAASETNHLTLDYGNFPSAGKSH